MPSGTARVEVTGYQRNGQVCDVCVCIHVCTLEMQQYIDISQYHDTLGSDTVSIYQIFNVLPSKCILIHTTDALCYYFCL